MSVLRQLAVLGEIDSANSTATPLAGGATFTGTAKDITNHAQFAVNVYADVASATDGLSIQQSSDGTNWDHADTYTIGAGSAEQYTINAHAQYMRVVYTNGAGAQSAFRLQTKLQGTGGKASSHRMKDTITGEDDGELVKAALIGENGDGNWHNVKTTADGNLTISDNSSGLSIAEGNVTGTSFIHKFGKAPDFDTADGFVTIWDGADDSLLGGGAMQYTYSTSADIGLISSSSASDTVDIEIQGLDSSYDLVTQTVTLTGQTDVDISGVGGTDLIRVFRMKNVGSTDLVGNVYIRQNGTTQTGGVPDTASSVRAIINNGNNQTLMAVYTIPNGYTGYMRDWYVATAGARRDTAHEMKLFARPFGQVFQLKHDSSIVTDGTSAYQHRYEEPEVFDAKTDIEMKVNTAADQAGVAGGFDIVLVAD